MPIKNLIFKVITKRFFEEPKLTLSLHRCEKNTKQCITGCTTRFSSHSLTNSRGIDGRRKRRHGWRPLLLVRRNLTALGVRSPPEWGVEHVSCFHTSLSQLWKRTWLWLARHVDISGSNIHARFGYNRRCLNVLASAWRSINIHWTFPLTKKYFILQQLNRRTFLVCPVHQQQKKKS